MRSAGRSGCITRAAAGEAYVLYGPRDRENRPPEISGRYPAGGFIIHCARGPQGRIILYGYIQGGTLVTTSHINANQIYNPAAICKPRTLCVLQRPSLVVVVVVFVHFAQRACQRNFSRSHNTQVCVRARNHIAVVFVVYLLLLFRALTFKVPRTGPSRLRRLRLRRRIRLSRRRRRRRGNSIPLPRHHFDPISTYTPRPYLQISQTYLLNVRFITFRQRPPLLPPPPPVWI